MAKQKCPKGMAKSIVRNAMKKHPKWTAKQISENYPVARSTAFREMQQIRDEKKASLIASEKPRLTVPHRYKESTVRLAVVGGFAVGVIFTITAAAVAGVI